MVKFLRTAALAALLVSVSTNVLAGDDRTERDRKARVALALAAARPHTWPTATAPMPHAPKASGALLDWSDVCGAKSKPMASPAKAPTKQKSGCSCGPACDCCGSCSGCSINKLRDSLVRVRRSVATPTDGRTASGSGTVIWTDGKQSLILTAAHVVNAGTGPVEVRASGHWYAGAVLAKDDAGDVAAILVAAALPAAAVAEHAPEVGADVTMIGCTSLWSKGPLAGSIKLDSGSFLLVGGDADQFSDSGDSGGGVFAGGKLVGVHCGKVGAPAKSYCANTAAVKKLLGQVLVADGAKISLRRPSPAKSAPSAPARRIIGYQKVCNGTSCYYVPIYESP